MKDIKLTIKPKLLLAVLAVVILALLVFWLISGGASSKFDGDWSAQGEATATNLVLDSNDYPNKAALFLTEGGEAYIKIANASISGNSITLSNYNPQDNGQSITYTLSADGKSLSCSSDCDQQVFQTTLYFGNKDTNEVKALFHNATLNNGRYVTF